MAHHYNGPPLMPPQGTDTSHLIRFLCEKARFITSMNWSQHADPALGTSMFGKVAGKYLGTKLVVNLEFHLPPNNDEGTYELMWIRDG